MIKMIRKLLLTLLTSFLFYNTTTALVITNANTQDIQIEMMDCVSYDNYGYPTTWTPSCHIQIFGKCLFSGNLGKVKFLVLNHLAPNSQLVIDENRESIPQEICIRIEGLSVIGSVKNNIKSSCNMTIYDNGYATGIRAEYHHDCK